MELRFNIKKEDAERAEQLVQQIRNPAGSIHAQVEYPVLRVVVNDLNSVDINALAKQIEGSLRTSAQPLDYATEAEFADLRRRAGIQLNEYMSAKTFNSLGSAIAFVQRFENSDYFTEFDLSLRPGKGWELTYTYEDLT
jgi:hypothetical protein